MKVVKLEECRRCGGYHRPGFEGDCRENSERFGSDNPADAIRELIAEYEDYYDIDNFSAALVCQAKLALSIMEG